MGSHLVRFGMVPSSLLGIGGGANGWGFATPCPGVVPVPRVCPRLGVRATLGGWSPLPPSPSPKNPRGLNNYSYGSNMGSRAGWVL